MNEYLNLNQASKQARMKNTQKSLWSFQLSCSQHKYSQLLNTQYKEGEIKLKLKCMQTEEAMAHLLLQTMDFVPL